MTEPSFISDIWEAAKQAGPFGMMLLLTILWIVNRERTKLQGERDALLERVLGAISDIADAMGETVQRRRTRPPT